MCVQAGEDCDEPGGHRNYISPALQTGLCDWSAKYFAQPVMKVASASLCFFSPSASILCVIFFKVVFESTSLMQHVGWVTALMKCRRNTLLSCKRSSMIKDNIFLSFPCWAIVLLNISRKLLLSNKEAAIWQEIFCFHINMYANYVIGDRLSGTLWFMSSGVTRPSEDMSVRLQKVLKKILKSYRQQQGRDQSQCEKVPAARPRWLCWIIELPKITSSWVKLKIKRSAFYRAQ